MKKIVGIGHALLDYEYELSQMWLEKLKIQHQDTILVEANEQDEKFKLLQQQQQRQISSGGSLTNSLCSAKLYNQYCGNNAVEFISIGAVGDDENGAIYRQDLQKIGIVSKHKTISNMHTGSCLVLLTPPDSRSMSTSLQASSHLTIDSSIQRDCYAADILVIEGYLLTSDELTNQIADVLQGIKNRSEQKTIIMLTLASAFLVANFHRNFAKIVDYADLVCGNTDEAKALFKVDDIQQASDKLQIDGDVIATDGKNGAYLLRKDVVLEQFPAQAVEVVNSLGAGDGFFGGVLSIIAEGGSITQAVQAGLQFGKIAVQTKGPRLTKAGIESIAK